MINFDALTLKAFLEENIEFLQGARIQKIQQPTRRDFIFGLRNSGETKKLYVNIHSNFFHVCFMSAENEKKRFIQIPKAPPMFCMLLRKYLEGARISKVNQPEGERILEFYFETQDELAEKIYICLAIELMGKHSNVVLYNYDTNVIIGCAHNVGAEKSREREMIGGLPYAYPPKVVKKDYLALLEFLKQQGKMANSVNATIDNYFADYQETEAIKTLKTKLLSQNSAKLKKIKGSLDKIQKQANANGKGDLYRKYGDLIMANLGVNVSGNKDFSKSIEIIDWETNSSLKIDLDDTMTLKENANKFYKLYNKAKTTALKTHEMTEKLVEEKDYIEQVLYSIDSAAGMEDLLDIQDELGLQDNLSLRAKAKQSKTNSFAQKSNLLTFQTSKPSFTIYIGKNNKQNDYIISKLAKDEDLWFHVHNCAGSHVLLRVENGAEPDDKTIFECAKFAKDHSSAKNSSKVGVIYTKRKFLKKPPGAKLGYVTYKNEKEIIVD